MRKMFIKGNPYVWRGLGYQYPDLQAGGEITIAFPENDPGARPLFLIDNNDTNPFASFSYANWLPAFGVEFRDAEGAKVSWSQPEDAFPFGLKVLFDEVNDANPTMSAAEKMMELGSRIMQEILQKGESSALVTGIISRTSNFKR